MFSAFFLNFPNFYLFILHCRSFSFWPIFQVINFPSIMPHLPFNQSINLFIIVSTSPISVYFFRTSIWKVISCSLLTFASLSYLPAYEVILKSMSNNLNLLIPPLLCLQFLLFLFILFTLLLYFYCWHHHRCPHCPPAWPAPTLPHPSLPPGYHHLVVCVYG